MREEQFKIKDMPTILVGETSEKVYLFVHGKGGSKEEAREFAKIANKKGWQVLSIDLPEHGERNQEKDTFNPWDVVPELKDVMNYAKQHWQKISLRANSIGAWFSMLSFTADMLEECLFVSPILDMEKLIHNMMLWASVSEEELQHEQEIKTNFGETLSWEYLMYAKEHPIDTWNVPTAILYAGNDNLTEKNIVDAFVAKFHCKLDVMENGEHWFHTPEQLEVLNRWTEELV